MTVHKMQFASRFIFALVTLTAFIGGCDQGVSQKGNFVIFKTAEEARKYVQQTSITGAHFELAISNDFTFAGRRDTTGAGMTIVVDAILAQEYIVDGFEQRDGYRLYHYKPLAAFQPPTNRPLQKPTAVSRPS